MRKARIENGVVREVLDLDPFPPFAPGLVWVTCGSSVAEFWTYDGATFTAPASADPLPAFRAAAQAALDAADITHQRIAEAVALGLNSWTNSDVVAWMTYRRALRAAVAAVSAGTLPTKPIYPAGT